VDYCEFLLKEWTAEDLNPPPLLTGHDLARHGLEPGPHFKRLLDAIREAQLDGSVKTRQQALDLADRLLAEDQK
jgi:poly(A) polymerase